MRDPSPRGSKAGFGGEILRKTPTKLGRFKLDDNTFELVLCHTNDAQDAAEVTRFDLNGATVAVISHPEAIASRPAAHDVLARLTGRELQIAALVAEGNATKNIAYKLRISEWTVGTHLRRIFAKLNVDNRAAMVYLCAPLIKTAAAADRAPPRAAPRAPMPRHPPEPQPKSRDRHLVKA
jgi:DNA-binding CsgD family transcriptional regulator